MRRGKPRPIPAFRAHRPVEERFCSAARETCVIGNICTSSPAAQEAERAPGFRSLREICGNVLIFFPWQQICCDLFGSGRTYWQSGTYDTSALIFYPEREGLLDYGSSFYAAKTQLDRERKRILWGWIPETRAVEIYRAAG